MTHKMQPYFNELMKFFETTSRALDKEESVEVVSGSDIHLALKDLVDHHKKGEIGFLPEESEEEPNPQKKRLAFPVYAPGIDGGEVYIDTVGGEKAVFPSYTQNKDGVDYVRIIDKRGVELVSWDQEEWCGDPEGVMGAILGAMMRGAKL